MSVNGNTSEGETYVTNILKGKPEERILRNLVTNTLEGKADVTNTLEGIKNTKEGKEEGSSQFFGRCILNGILGIYVS